MDKQNINFYLIYFIIFVVAIIVIVHHYNNKIEGYSNELFLHIKEGKENNYWDQLREGRSSYDCYNHPNDKCMEYSNCGLCMKDGQINCIPGDVQGPFFKEDCQGWMYTNVYDRHIFKEKVATITPPWNRFYPDYETKYPSPQSRSTL